MCSTIAAIRTIPRFHVIGARLRPFAVPNTIFKQADQRLFSTKMAQTEHSTSSDADPVIKSTEEKLPKLSAQDFKIFNRLAEHMDMFHNHFRQTWNTLYAAASSGKRPQGMSIRQYTATGEEFVHHLTMHHTIEEQHYYPILAKRMPEFGKEVELLTQHKRIHEGLDVFEAYLKDCKSGEKELRMSEVKSVMDGFGAVLWQHLDEEVEQLGAENMRRAWSKEEMQRLWI